MIENPKPQEIADTIYAHGITQLVHSPEMITQEETGIIDRLARIPTEIDPEKRRRVIANTLTFITLQPNEEQYELLLPGIQEALMRHPDLAEEVVDILRCSLENPSRAIESSRNGFLALVPDQKRLKQLTGSEEITDIDYFEMAATTLPSRFDNQNQKAREMAKQKLQTRTVMLLGISGRGDIIEGLKKRSGLGEQSDMLKPLFDHAFTDPFQKPDEVTISVQDSLEAALTFATQEDSRYTEAQVATILAASSILTRGFKGEYKDTVLRTLLSEGYRKHTYKAARAIADKPEVVEQITCDAIDTVYPDRYVNDTTTKEKLSEIILGWRGRYNFTLDSHSRDHAREGHAILAAQIIRTKLLESFFTANGSLLKDKVVDEVADIQRLISLESRLHDISEKTAIRATVAILAARRLAILNGAIAEISAITPHANGIAAEFSRGISDIPAEWFELDSETVRTQLGEIVSCASMLPETEQTTPDIQFPVRVKASLHFSPNIDANVQRVKTEVEMLRAAISD